MNYLSSHWHGFALAIPMIAVLSGFYGSASAQDLKIGGTGAALGAMQLLAKAFGARYPGMQTKIVPNLGSAGGIQAVANGAIDLAVTARLMKQEEQKLGLTEFEYGRTPFVFAVSTKSKINSTTTAQLASIYAGQQTQWPDGSVIRLILRPVSDTDSEMVKNISPELRQAVLLAQQRPGIRISTTDQEAADDLEKLPGAIGPTSLSLILSEKRQLKVLTLDGKSPTVSNLASGVYPHFKRLYLVTGIKRSATADLFSAFVQSPAGRKLLVETGHWIP